MIGRRRRVTRDSDLTTVPYVEWKLRGMAFMYVLKLFSTLVHLEFAPQFCHVHDLSGYWYECYRQYHQLGRHLRWAL